MKMMYNGTQIKSLNVKHYEMDTNDCDMVASDLQAGKTAVARGKKITGTGKSFEFAMYGRLETNFPTPIPTDINVIEIASTDYPVQLNIALSDMKNTNFNTEQIIGNVIINNQLCPITVKVEYNLLMIDCKETIYLQVFYGKDNYI